MRFISSTSIRWVNPRSAGLVGLLLMLSASSHAAERVHIAHCAQVCPQAPSAREIVVHHLYAAAIDPGSGLAEWVAYRVSGGSVGVASLLPRAWQADPLLEEVPEELAAAGEDVTFVQPDLSNAQDREYRVNEVVYQSVDRGRLAPMTSFAGTPYWDELNNLSNMAPLPENLRTGSWARLEQRINALAAREGEVFVVSGPMGLVDVDSGETETPSAYFKVVRSGDRVAAFVFPVELPPHVDYCAQRSTLAAIESGTGLTVLPSLAAEPASLELALECSGSNQG